MNNALLQTDAYKLGHIKQYIQGTEVVYSNFTARSGKHSGIKDCKGVYFVGLQHFVKEYLIDEWNTSFFSKPRDQVVKRYKRFVDKMLNSDVDVSHIGVLHDLGYLPITIKALPEGSFVPFKVPLLTVINNIPEFFWLTNYIETVLSCEMWLGIASATRYMEFKKTSLKYSELTCNDNSFVPFQNHDFSMRGMQNRQSAAVSGFAVLAMGSVGTDTLPAIELAEDYYGANIDEELVGCSVPASEHSTQTSYGVENELESIRHLIEDVYPDGIFSMVSDSWDFWQLVTEYLPALKDTIMNRNGKLTIRPDSGDPVDIICGTYSVLNGRSPEQKGLIECLWETFGGTINSKGYKELDPHIGAIYGDSITLERQDTILRKLMEKGFASNNIVFGVGSYTYGMVSRDSFGIAFKSTYVKVNGVGKPIFKDPKTDSDGTKKSAKGLLMVSHENGQYTLNDDVDAKQEKHGCLEVVFKDGKLVKETTLAEIRQLVNKSL
jgi:nicotinamide phosphoribosyltransferase